MRIPRIYTPQNLSVHQRYDLELAASRHIIHVLRMRVGRELILFNNQGGQYQARLAALNKKIATVYIESYTDRERESPLSIELGIGIARSERMDWIIQKTTELGISAIVPLLTERTTVKLNDKRLEKKQQHWQHIISSACEQCLRNTLPTLCPPQALETWLTTNRATQKFVLHPHATSYSLQTLQAPAQVSLLIGPEGGLSEEEIKQALETNFLPLKLGPRILRTETAPVAALSILQYLWGDLSI